MNQFINIEGWRSDIRFSSAHIIHEYDKCGRLHGHTYAVNVKIFGKPDEKGIIVDFSMLKDTLRKIISTLDHRILIPEKSSILKIEKYDENVKISALGKTYEIPLVDCVFLPIKSTSAENLTAYILEKVFEDIDFPNTIKSVEIGVDEGFGQGARIEKEL